MIASPSDVVPLPPEVNTIGLLREYLQLDQLQAASPDHELFIVAYKTLPENPFAPELMIPAGFRSTKLYVSPCAEGVAQRISAATIPEQSTAERTRSKPVIDDAVDATSSDSKPEQHQRGIALPAGGRILRRYRSRLE